jgi:nucleoside-diphosphate-sugar epimerase
MLRWSHTVRERISKENINLHASSFFIVSSSNDFTTLQGFPAATTFAGISLDTILPAPIKEFLPMQAGDVYQTYADVTELQRDFGFKPDTSLKDGINSFVRWYKDYYKIG